MGIRRPPLRSGSDVPPKGRAVFTRPPAGQLLLVLLDQEGVRNVPESTRQDGHTVLSVKQQADGWRVLIRKS